METRNCLLLLDDLDRAINEAGPIPMSYTGTRNINQDSVRLNS